MTVTRLLARPLLASMFLVGGANALKDPGGRVPAAQPVIDKISANLRPETVKLFNEELDRIRK